MHTPAILIIDQGTSATKAFIFDRQLHPLYSRRISHSQQRLRPGWVESDPVKISEACTNLLADMVNRCQSQFLEPVAVGMAFQRSTFLFWDKKTAEPLTPAITWQDTRAQPITDQMMQEGSKIQALTGIPLSPHFGGPKFLFTLQNDASLRSRIQSGSAVFGPLSSYITCRLTGKTFIDESIAGRTLLYNLVNGEWDSYLMKLFQVSETCLPEIVSTCAHFGNIKVQNQLIPILCVIGDQQASLIGLGCNRIGEIAMNFGTSGSVLANTGEKLVIIPSLLSNVLYSSESPTDLGGVKKCIFLLEGTINSVSSLFDWIKVHLRIRTKNFNWEESCRTSTEGVLVPGLNGISAPYWTKGFEPVLFGFSKQSVPEKIIRAGMESIGFLVHDICEVIEKEGGIKIPSVMASGGYSKSVLLQFIADILNIPVQGYGEKDATAAGVAVLIARQIWNNPIDDFQKTGCSTFTPSMSDKKREIKIEQWKNALKRLKII